MAKLYYYLVVLLMCVTKNECSTILCESGFCRSYLTSPGCRAPAPDCGINNATHTGMWMLSPTTCNCCDFCLPFIGENQECSRGGPGMGTTIGRCGAGLTCADQTTGGSICQRMTTECHTAQDTFDARHQRGETGALEERPQCDEKGDFAPFSCVPTQTCFCQSKEGKRIFGEVLYTGAATKENMHCGCARLHEKIKKLILPGVLYPIVGPLCTADGNFHPIQCLDRMCYCVDPITGVIRDGPNRKINVDIQPKTRLECYDAKLDNHPEQSEGRAPFNYTTPCVEQMTNRIELMDESRDQGFIVDFHSTVHSCEPDWTFGRLAVRNGTKICVDERGRRIGDYKADQGTPEYDSMDCKCAYTSHVVMANELEHPVCCSNGNFRSIQCRRGFCRCVDSDGRQVGQENADPQQLRGCWTPNWRTC